MNYRYFFTLLFVLIGLFYSVEGQNGMVRDKFKQLREELPTPGTYRAANGAPGPDYWQQRADYKIDVEINDVSQRLIANEVVTYHNNSPLPLDYLWLQVDQNIFSPNSDALKIRPADPDAELDAKSIAAKIKPPFAGEVQFEFVRDASGRVLPYTLVETMMRIDLPASLKKGEQFTFSIGWSFNIYDATKGARTGYEFFPEDSNYIYEIAQWFPRMCVFDEVNGWQTKHYLGRGEFALEFGNYSVSITVPSDHIVAATGTLTNAREVLTAEELYRFDVSKKSEKPIFIVTPEEARSREKSRSVLKKTWKFEALNVRDFAFATSRKFIWDGATVSIGNKPVWCSSFFPKEGQPLWDKYSTHVVMHTIKTYSKYALDYPYPSAISVHGPVGGMEHPMIAFNGGRPQPDGTYPDHTKYGLISVVIHEVGHNYFPMIISSDERQWTWMDEGLNTFVQFLAEQEFMPKYPSRRGIPQNIVPYMTDTKQNPIMTNSESILQFGNNAYGKPATALYILRETVLGRELFDFAFTTYCKRWAFRHPEPADFFRTMEDASGIDLDWFWHGWFYTNDYVDIGLDSVRTYEIKDGDPIKKEIADRKADADKTIPLTIQRFNKQVKYYVSDKPELNDFYTQYDKLKPTEAKKTEYEFYLASLSEEEIKTLEEPVWIHHLYFSNKGGLVMPLILQINYVDSTTEEMRFPAEVWVKNNERFVKEIITRKAVKSFEVDPNRETADADIENNYYPGRYVPTRYELFKSKLNNPNIMQEMRK